MTSSRWQAALPDGLLIERHGIAPQVAVDAPVSAYATDDPILRRALLLIAGDKAP